MATRSIALAFVVLVGSAALCHAQGYSFGQPGSPTTSPYLNLIPGSNFSPALNYYRSYKPEREFRRDTQQLNRSVSRLQKEIDVIGVADQKATSLLGTTGHSTTFNNLGNYYPSRR